MRKLVRESMKININTKCDDMFSKDISRNDLMNVNCSYGKVTLKFRENKQIC
jgi:hypothetical protein